MSIYGPGFAAAYNRDWAFWAEHLWPLLERVIPESARTWLDLCCGTGSMLAKAVEAGCEVVGMDASPHQLDHARRNAPKAELVHADVRDLDIGRSFDVITCLFDSLNYLAEPADFAGVLRRAKKHLAPRGRFVFDVNTYEGLQDAWQRTSAVRDPDHTVIIESSFDEETGIARAVITGFVREGDLYRRFEEEHVERGYRANEVGGMLVDVGFVFEVYDGHSLEAPEERSGRLVYVCRHGEDAQ